MTIPVRIGKIPLIRASAEAIAPYLAFVTPGTSFLMVLLRGPSED